MLQRTAPGGSALQLSETLALLYQTAPVSVKIQIRGAASDTASMFFPTCEIRFTLYEELLKGSAP